MTAAPHSGLATRTVLATDSRFRQIQLTKSSQHMVRVLQKRLQEIQNTLMARLDPTEARTILSVLWKIADKRPVSTKQPVRPTRKSKPARPFENAPKRWWPAN